MSWRELSARSSMASRRRCWARELDQLEALAPRVARAMPYAEILIHCAMQRVDAGELRPDRRRGRDG